jgi:hypothetical protein
MALADLRGLSITPVNRYGGEIRRAIEAYYENLSDGKKRNARFSFNKMHKNEVT